LLRVVRLFQQWGKALSPKTTDAFNAVTAGGSTGSVSVVANIVIILELARNTEDLFAVLDFQI
jgi:hypothetical protein